MKIVYSKYILKSERTHYIKIIFTLIIIIIILTVINKLKIIID